jgi:hypothetical protein
MKIDCNMAKRERERRAEERLSRWALSAGRYRRHIRNLSRCVLPSAASTLPVAGWAVIWLIIFGTKSTRVNSPSVTIRGDSF